MCLCSKWPTTIHTHHNALRTGGATRLIWYGCIALLGCLVVGLLGYFTDMLFLSVLFCLFSIFLFFVQTYFVHYLPVLICFSMIAVTLVTSLLQYPVTTVAGSAYQTFEAERKRRERERLLDIENERKEMEEARRIGREIGQQDEDWNNHGAETKGAEHKDLDFTSLDGVDNDNKYAPPSVPFAPVMDSSTVSPLFDTALPIAPALTREQMALTSQEQFINMLDAFSVARDPKYMISGNANCVTALFVLFGVVFLCTVMMCIDWLLCVVYCAISVLHSLKDLFSESSELRQEASTKTILIQRAKSKRRDDSNIWTEEVAVAFGTCLKSLSLLGRLGLDVRPAMGGSGNGEGNVISDGIKSMRDGLILN